MVAAPAYEDVIHWAVRAKRANSIEQRAHDRVVKTLFDDIEGVASARLKAIRGMEHDTVIGPISFDEKGDVTRSIYTIWTVKNLKRVLYETTK